MSELVRVRIQRCDSLAIVQLTGEIDLSNASAVRDELLAAVERPSSGLIVDGTGLRYIDSVGIRSLFELALRLKERDQALRLVLPEESPIRRVIEITALDTIAPVLASVGEAEATAAQEAEQR